MNVAGPYTLLMRDTGQLVITGINNTVIWTVGTSGTDAPYTLSLDPTTSRACIFGNSNATTPHLCMPSNRIVSVSGNGYNKGNTLDQSSSLVDNQGNRILLDNTGALRYISSTGVSVPGNSGPILTIPGPYTLII